MRLYNKTYYPLKSFAFSIITIMHCILNAFGRKIRLNKTVFLVQKKELVLSRLDKFFSPTRIITHNVFDYTTFLKRYSNKETIAFNNLITSPFFSVCFSEKAMQERLQHFYSRNYHALLQKSRVEKMIMTDEESVPNNSAISACKELKILTISLQHGLISEDYLLYLTREKYNGRYELPNYLITYGLYEKQVFKKVLKTEASSIIPLGSPRHDLLARYNLDNEAFRNKHGIPKNKRIIFWAVVTHSSIMSKNGENNLNTDIIFRTIKNNNNDYFLIIKFHPGENARESFRYYNHYVNTHSLRNIIILSAHSESTYDCIEVSDAVIVANSTVGLEAILMNKPVINMATKTELHLDSFKELESCLIVKEENELIRYLNLIRTKKYTELFRHERKKFIRRHFSNFGNATPKVAEFIKKAS